jgi:hypothetical protein
MLKELTYICNLMEQTPTEAGIYSPSHRNVIQLRCAVVRREKLVAEVGDSMGTQRKESVRR